MGADPQGLDREGRRDIYFFIHNVYANFFKDVLDYFSLHLYPRFEYKVVGTYDKAVEYLNKQCEANREIDKPNLPALILNPSGDFELADGNAGGKQLWRFPNLAPGMVKRVFDPVYQDENIQIDVGFMRIQGDIELLMLLNSFYEYCDLKMLFLEIFGGFERWIYPQFFNTFIILPDELINYRYTNEYTGLSYKIDWDTAGAYSKLVRSIAKDELVLPCNIKPIYKLSGVSDGSQRYGGADQLADWRLTATIKYEIELPAFLVMQTDYLVENIDINIYSGSTYSEYDYSVPTFKLSYRKEIDWGLDETSNSTINPDATCADVYEKEYNFNTRLFHLVTQADVDSTGDLNIQLSFTIDDLNGIRLNSNYGEMDYGDHYTLTNNGTTLTIKRDNVNIFDGMVIELYLYNQTVMDTPPTTTTTTSSTTTTSTTESTTTSTAESTTSTTESTTSSTGSTTTSSISTTSTSALTTTTCVEQPIFGCAFSDSTSMHHEDIIIENDNRDARKAPFTVEYRSAKGVPSHCSGKRYFEVEIIDDGGAGNFWFVGVADDTADLSTYPGGDSGGWGYYGNDGSKYYDTVQENYGNSYTINDIIGVAVDIDNGKIWWSKNGVWQGGGDPSAAINPAYSNLIVENIWPIIGMINPNAAVRSRFIADELAYSLPAFYSAWCGYNPNTTTSTTESTTTSTTESTTTSTTESTTSTSESTTSTSESTTTSTTESTTSTSESTTSTSESATTSTTVDLLSYCVELVHSDDVDGSNTFVDSSPVGRALTPAGTNAQHDTDEQYFCKSSILFDGNDMLQSSLASEDFRFLTAAWAIDFFFKLSVAGDNQYFFDMGVNGTVLRVGTTNHIEFFQDIAPQNLIIDYDWSGSIDTAWHHVAVEADGAGNQYLYLDGSIIGSASDAGNFGEGAKMTFGNYGIDGTFGVHGWMDELRVFKGIQIGNGTTYPVPTGPLDYTCATTTTTTESTTTSSISTTSTTLPPDLFLRGWGDEVDYTWRINNGGVFRMDVHDNEEGSWQFSGATQFGTVETPALDHGTGNWEIEMAFFPTNAGTTSTLFSHRFNATNGYYLAVDASRLHLWYYDGSLKSISSDVSSFSNNQWYNIKVAKESDGEIHFYRNSVDIGGGVVSDDIKCNGATPLIVGARGPWATPDMRFWGYIESFKFWSATYGDISNWDVKGLFTPQNPIINVGEPLHHHFGWELGEGGSYYVDATNYFSIPDDVAWYLDGDFTCEALIYPTQAGGVLLEQYLNAGNYWRVGIDVDKLYFDINGSQALTDSGVISQNTWQLITICRVSGTYYMFVDGDLKAHTGTPGAGGNIAQPLKVGIYFKGYMKNIKLYNGIGLYTESFTPIPIGIGDYRPLVGDDDGQVDEADVYDSAVVEYTLFSYPRRGAARFQLPIPNGATILSCQFSHMVNSERATATHTIKMEDTDNAARLTNGVYSGLSKLTGVASQATGALVGGDWVTYNDMAATLQTIIDKVGWEADNYVNVFVEFVSGARQDYDTTEGGNPSHLYITWQTGGA